MSNRIDFFQSEESKLALPACEVSILVDGALCPWLELIEVVRCGWPEFSWARLAYNPAVYSQGGLTAFEEIEDKLAMGKSICVQQVYNSGAPGAVVSGLPVFVGQIERIDSELGSAGERVEITARDLSAEFERITVYGRRVRDIDGSGLFLDGGDTVFGEDGKADGSLQAIQNNGKSYTVFCTDPSSAKAWSYAEVIDYLLCEYVLGYQLQRPSAAQLQVLTEGQTVSDLDVTGLNLLRALYRCCERAGVGFKFMPSLSKSGGDQQIVFYRDSHSRTIELGCQRAGEQLSISKTNIVGLKSKKNFWPVTHKYIGQGDYKIFEATFDLVEGWDSADESLDYDEFSPSTNSDFYKVKNVYRKWCLNEAGDYSGAPYSRGAAFDFSKIFGTSNFAHRRRRFWPCLTTDKQGKSLGYYLQVSFDDGANWRQYMGAFENRLDECGIWLSSDRVDVDTWVASLKGVLKFRLTGSVVSDERLSCTIADGPVDSAARVVEHVFTLPRQFKYRQVSGQSVFANSTDDSLGAAGEADDGVGLYGFVRKWAAEDSEVIETIDLQTPCFEFDYRVGDKVVTGVDSRDLLGCGRDNRSVCRVERVVMDFEKQCTNLKIVRKRSV